MYNFNVEENGKERKGTVNRDAGTFKYAVQVYLDGEEVNEVEAKDFADVKVVDAEEAVSIQKVALDNKNDVDYLVVGEEGAKFKVTEAKNALGEDLDEDSLAALSGELKKVVSDDVQVAYVDDKTITARKLGKVTFTLTYYEDDDAIEVKLPVEVKKLGVATTVEAENQKAAEGTPVKELDFKVFDQHGLDITNSEDAYFDRIKNVDGDVVKDLSKKGIYTVEILDKVKTDKDAKVLGSFTVTVVEVKEADIEDFKIVKADEKAKFEITDVEGEITKTPVVLNIEGYVDGVKVTADKVAKALEDNDAKFTLDIDEKVATANREGNKITVTPVKAGTTTLKLFKAEGDYETVLADFEVTVENKVEAIDKLTLKEDTKVVIGNDERLYKASREKAVVAAVEKDQITRNQIERVELVESQDKVIVIIKDDFGGKEFTLDAQYVDGTVVRTDDELKEAVKAGGTVVLSADIKVTNELKIEEKVTLDGNGYKLTNDTGLRVINATGIDGLTIKNVVFDNAGAVYVESFKGKIEITGNTFKNNRGTALILDLVTINGELNEEQKTGAMVIVEDNDFTEAKDRLVADHHGLYVDDIMEENIFGKAVESVNDQITKRPSAKVIQFKIE